MPFTNENKLFLRQEKG